MSITEGGPGAIGGSMLLTASSSDLASTMARRTGAMLLSEANDLKRTVSALAEEIRYPEADLTRLLAGGGRVDEYRALAAAMATTYPIDESMLLPLQDDCFAGGRLMRADESEATGRLVRRIDGNGMTTDYYEYRDTAFSRLSPFRPEWIRQLVIVDRCDPNDARVVFNRGHLLHQYTMYLGPVNYYWECAGERFGAEMTTGDSTYGTPWWPHTFASRRSTEDARILAVTFGSAVRRALRELAIVGQRSNRFTLPYREGAAASVRALVTRHLDDALVSRAELRRRLEAAGCEVDVEDLLEGDSVIPLTTLTNIAAALDVELQDLLIPEYRAEDEVRLQRAESTVPISIPDVARPSYQVRPLARVSKAPTARGSAVRVLAPRVDDAHVLSTSLHSWIYNYGDAPAQVWWSDGISEQTVTLRSDDSLYLQPFISHRFAARDGTADLCVMRVGGAVDLDTQRELSYLSEIERVIFEDGPWF